MSKNVTLPLAYLTIHHYISSCPHTIGLVDIYKVYLFAQRLPHFTGALFAYIYACVYI